MGIIVISAEKSGVLKGSSFDGAKKQNYALDASPPTTMANKSGLGEELGQTPDSDVLISSPLLDLLGSRSEFSVFVVEDEIGPESPFLKSSLRANRYDS